MKADRPLGVSVSDQLSSEDKQQERGRFKGRVINMIEGVKSFFYSDKVNQTPSTRALSNRVVKLPKPPKSDAPCIFKADNEQLDIVISAMSKRANQASQDLLNSLRPYVPPMEVFIASNGKKNEDARYAIMCIKDKAPSNQHNNMFINSENQYLDPVVNLLIDDSLWIELLVADPKSGLGSTLLDQAEIIARAKGKKGLALSAYEFDPKDNDKDSTEAPYSIADYYAQKKGFAFTGQANEEIEQEDSGESVHYFYPIYVKPLSIPKNASERNDSKS